MGDFKAAMTEWVTLKAQLLAARKDLQVLNKREKELREFVTQHMAQNEIDTVRIQDKVKVNLKKKKTKGAVTKDVIRRGLLTFFGGDEAQAEGAFNCIMDAAPIKESNGVTVSGLKDL